MKLAYKLHVKEGAVDATLPPIILLHCAFESKNTWEMVALPLAESTHRKVYAIDFRNHGDSPFADDHNAEVLQNDLIDFMVQLNIPKAVFIGHSMGGLVAMYFASKYPHKTEKLIIEDTGLRKPEKGMVELASYMVQLIQNFLNETACADEESMEQEIKGFFKSVSPVMKLPEDFFDNYPLHNLPIKSEGEHLSMKSNNDVVSKSLVNGDLFTDMEAAYDGEALFLCGLESQYKIHEDPLIPKYFPRAVFKEYDKLGHFIHYLYKESYVPVELAFNFVEPEDCDKEKAPVLFLHGMTSSKEYWNDIPQIIANATKRKVYVVDARNHGDSEWSDVFNFEINVDDLLHFMDKHNIPKAILVGHSMGGITSMKTALKSPERVEKLIIEDTFARVAPQPLMEAVAAYIGAAKTGIELIAPDTDKETAEKFVIEYLHENLPPEFQKPLNSNYRIQLKKTSDGKFAFKSNMDVLERFSKTYTEDLMKEISGLYDKSSCFIYGKISTLFRLESDEPYIKNFFPNSEFVGIDDATHTVHIDHPKEFVEALLNFLQKE